jgi:hypothetical protein
MRHFTPLCGTLLLSFLTACGPTVATPTGTGTDAEQLALLQKQIQDLTKSSASPTPAAGSIPSTATTMVKAMQAQPSVITLAAGQQKSIETVILVLENNSVSVLNKFDLLEISSGDPSVATVSKEGVITALKDGVTPISLKLGNINQTLVVTVSATAPTATATPTPTATATPVPAATATPTPEPTATATPASPYKELGVDQATYTLKALESKLVTLTITLNEIDPDTGLNKSGFLSDQTKATWTSSNTAVASISASGLISANSVGTTTMTVTYQGLTKTFTVTVTAS